MTISSYSILTLFRQPKTRSKNFAAGLVLKISSGKFKVIDKEGKYYKIAF